MRSRETKSRRAFLATSVGAAAAVLTTSRPARASLEEGPAGTRRILALVASPRKGGNTDILTDALLEGARGSGAAVEKVYLIDRQIAPCRKCDACHAALWNPCRIRDDFNPLVERMLKADVIVLATPIWWSSVHSLLKLLLDRCYSLVSKDWSQCRLAGKGFALVACQGQKDLNLYAERFVTEFKVYEEDMKIKVLGSVVASAYQKGEVAADKEAMSRATELGRRLAMS